MRAQRLGRFVAAAFMALAGCSSFVKYNVNGHDLLVLRDMEEVYPLYASTLKLSLETAISTKGDVARVVAGGRYEHQVQRLYDQLDNINADARQEITAAYSKYVTAMSAAGSATERDAAAAAFDSAIRVTTELAAKVRVLMVQIANTRIKESGSEWDKLFEVGEGVATFARQAGLLKK